MPVKIPNTLPARAILESENVFVMGEERAQHQDIRPLKVAILNLMPTKIATETQLLRLLGNTSVQVEVTLVRNGFLQEPYDGPGFQDAARRAFQALGGMRCYVEYQQPPHIQWDDATYQGDAYPTYSWACYGAEVSVDTATWEITVDAFVTGQEVGRVLNPNMAAGQIEGGVAQGLGWALWEKVEMVGGRMANNQMSNYIVPTFLDLPRIRVRFEENPYALGPGGGKGLGELPMDGPAPAVLNAVQAALGCTELREVPLTPERLLAAMEAWNER